MRELFYRRADQSLGGYKVVAKEAGISAKEEVFVSQKAMPASVGEALQLTYKQCCVDDAVMVSCGYFDVHGNRGSGLAHVLLTEDDMERAALLDAYPLSSGFFTRLRDDFAADESIIQRKEHRVPLKQFVGLRADEPRDALKRLRAVFPDGAMLRQLFDALMDAASANPHMVAVVLEGEATETLAETGRSLAEALFSCLPEVVAARLGYQSPAFNLNDVTFGLRFMNQVTSARSGMSFVFAPVSGQVFLPVGYRDEPGEYATALARLVMDGSDAAHEKIRALREQINDWAMSGSKTVPQDIAMRYAFVERRAALSKAEVKRLLAWHHAQIERAAKDGQGDCLIESRFWHSVNKWVTTEYLAPAWTRQSEWNDSDGIYSSDQVRALFEDGQRLFELRREESAAYQALFSVHLKAGDIYPAAEMPAFEKHLLASFSDQIQKARDMSFAKTQLYWEPMEEHVRDKWVKGSAAWDGQLSAALKKLYEMAPNTHGDIAKAYAMQIIRANQPLSGGDSSKIRNHAVALIYENDKDYIAASMKRELGANPYQSPAAVSRFIWYRDYVANNSALRTEYESICREHLNHTVAGCTAADIEPLLDELDGGRGKGVIETTELILPDQDIADRVRARVAALAASTGLCDYFPDHPETARKLAELLDESAQGPAKKHVTLFNALERVRTLTPGALTDDALSNYVDDFNRVLSKDSRATQKARDMLRTLAKTQAQDAETGHGAELMRLLVMRRYDRDSVDLGQIARDFEKLNVPESKIRAVCRKHANVEAESGLGYIAAELENYLKTPAKKREDLVIDYPRAPGYAAEEEEEERPRSAGAFAGFPTAVAAGGIALFGSGLAASVFGLIKMIGLI